MEKRQPYYKKMISPLVCLVLMLTFACAKEENFVGTYRATEKNPPEYAKVIVELKEDGTGIRRGRGEDVTFEWEAKGDEIRIYTKGGGIVMAKVQQGVLEVSLPGPKIFYFKKIE
jgi:hypothetical protein